MDIIGLGGWENPRVCVKTSTNREKFFLAKISLLRVYYSRKYGFEGFDGFVGKYSPVVRKLKVR